MKIWILALFLACLTNAGMAQDYHAIAGSNYAGALGVHQNPASIVNTPYPWDITLVGLQAKYQTNAIKVIDYSLLSSPVQSKFLITSGNFSRKGNEQLNLNLLNTRFNWGRKTAFAFGANIRSFANITSDPYNFIDTLESIHQFFALNEGTLPLKARIRTSNWIELYGSVARSLVEDHRFRLNAGATLKVNRGLAGGRTEAEGVQRELQIIDGQPQHVITNGQFAYGYSSNFDRWDTDRSSTENIREFVQTTQAGFSMDLGLELLIKPAGDATSWEDEETYYDYEWKFGASLMDLGYAMYRYSSNSRVGSLPPNGVSGGQLDTSFLYGITDIESFNDSVRQLFTVSNLSGNFRIWTPARIVLNVDRYLTKSFYVNAELNLNVINLLGNQRLYSRNLNRIRVTPRWESRRWGAYLPLQFNTQNQFWVGAAFKAGPLLLGLHNLGNVFGKNSMANGGGYLAITIRPGRKVTKGTRFPGIDCPPL